MFGKDLSSELVSVAGDSLFVRSVKNADDYVKVKQECVLKDRGVIYLAECFQLGADLKFAKEAVVILEGSWTMEREELEQKLARGNRAMGHTRGVLFCLGDEDQADALRMKILTTSCFDFLDGALNLVRYENFYDKAGATKLNTLMKRTKGEWAVSACQLTELVPSK